MGFMLAAGAALMVGGMLSSYSNQRKAANAAAKGAEDNYRLRLQQAEQVMARFKYNRIRERLNAQRFSGKQIVAFANSGVTGKTTTSVIEDTIGIVEESLFNKQMEAESKAYTIRLQGKLDKDAGLNAAKAAKQQATAGLLKNVGSSVIGAA